MSFTICPTCSGKYQWSWEEAFYKFGFDDGGGIVMTKSVAWALRRAHLEVTVEPWSWHNWVITDIKRDGASLIPTSVSVGYDDPRDYLPDDIIALLDREFPENAEVRP